MSGRFATRSSKLERLDTGDYTPAEYARWQREMRVIHRVLGEMRALKHAMLPYAAETRSVLDVGAGSGELLRAVRRWLGDKALLTGVEINVEAARTIVHGEGIVTAVRADALELPFADKSFDIVFCSLFLHHLTDQQAVAMLREMGRVTRTRVIVIDLHRSPVAYYFYRAASRLLLQRFTSEDGSLSIMRSFKPAELRRLATDAGLTHIEVRRSAAYRLVLSAK